MGFLLLTLAATEEVDSRFSPVPCTAPAQLYIQNFPKCREVIPVAKELGVLASPKSSLSQGRGCQQGEQPEDPTFPCTLGSVWE